MFANLLEHYFLVSYDSFAEAGIHWDGEVENGMQIGNSRGNR